MATTFPGKPSVESGAQLPTTVFARRVQTGHAGSAILYVVHRPVRMVLAHPALRARTGRHDARDERQRQQGDKPPAQHGLIVSPRVRTQHASRQKSVTHA